MACLVLAGAFYIVCLQIPPGRCEKYFEFYWQNPSESPHLCIVGVTVENEDGTKLPVTRTYGPHK